MKVLLTGGGSGGHITPLLAVARELKALDNTIEVIGICEKEAKFLQLFKDEPSIDGVYQVAAGKYRRFGGLSTLQKLTNFAVHAKNARDLGKVCAGYFQALKLLKQLRPDGILIKGGFVGVPVGLAAATLSIPFITHDSDTTPGLANRVVSKWASKYATGMPAEFYAYPKEKTVYTGVPVKEEFQFVTADIRAKYKADLGLSDCKQIISIIGGSQGGQQLNEDILAVAARLMQNHPSLGIIHIVGPAHETVVSNRYSSELLADERKRVVVKGFVTDVYRHTGAADIVISRASATVIAELAVQGSATILVPGMLAGDHQAINARHLQKAKVAEMVLFGDSEGLFESINSLLNDQNHMKELSDNIHALARPHAATDLAQLLLKTFRAGKRASAYTI